MSKLAILTSLALLLTVGYASAQQNTMTAGRPSAVLNATQCQEVWSKAVPTGDTLAQADAAPYIVNFAQVDTDNDGTIDKKEFEAACGKGLVKYTSH
jgi:Tfp pilus tip-associated adhesin PilY1